MTFLNDWRPWVGLALCWVFYLVGHTRGWVASQLNQRRREFILRSVGALEACGFEILEREGADTVSLGEGNLYPILRELEAEGVLTSHEVPGPPSRGGRPRRYYRLKKPSATN